MACCKCKEYHWEAPFPESFPGEDGLEYCIFHAPANHPQKTLDTLKHAILTKILATNHERTCKLSGAIFPLSLSFYDLIGDDGLPGLDFSETIFENTVDFSHCAFKGPAIFIGATFKNEATFESTQFLNVANFNQAKFQKRVYFFKSQFSWAHFEESIFVGPVTLDESSFSGKLFCKESSFQNSLSCKKSLFKSKIAFDSVVFHGKTDFSGTDISQSSVFYNCDFKNDSIFTGCTFQGETIFRVSKFYGKNHFNDCLFSNSTTFQACLFNNETLFSYSVFDSNLNIKWTEVSGTLHFFKTVFSGKADFSGAKFYSDVSFRGAEFKNIVLFGIATVQNYEDFFFRRNPSLPQYVIFKGTAEFSEADFREKLNFNGSHFKSFTEFKNVNFGSKVTFNDVNFENNVYFDESIISDDMSFWHDTRTNLPKQGEISFKKCSISSYVKITQAYVGNFNFFDVDLSKFYFFYCTWKTDREGHSCIFDKHTHLNLDDIEKQEFIYRSLKKSCIDNHDELMASEWHYQEKYLCEKKLNIKKEKSREDSILWLFLFLYKKCSGFGERPIVAISTLSILIVILFLLIFLSRLSETIMPPWEISCSAFSDTILAWLKLLTFSSPKHWHEDLFYVLALIVARIIIPIQSALLAFSLRNKFRR